jgi:hypothetical protein
MLRVANPFRPLFPTAFKNGPKGAHAFKLFQGEMRLLLDKLKSRGAPSEDDQDIAAQLYRVLKEHPDIPEGRILSEIGMLFVEGFETTGHTTSWTLSQVRGVAGGRGRDKQKGRKSAGTAEAQEVWGLRTAGTESWQSSSRYGRAGTLHLTGSSTGHVSAI